MNLCGSPVSGDALLQGIPTRRVFRFSARRRGVDGPPTSRLNRPVPVRRQGRPEIAVRPAHKVRPHAASTVRASASGRRRGDVVARMARKLHPRGGEAARWPLVSSRPPENTPLPVPSVQACSEIGCRRAGRTTCVSGAEACATSESPSPRQNRCSAGRDCCARTLAWRACQRVTQLVPIAVWRACAGGTCTHGRRTTSGTSKINAPRRSSTRRLRRLRYRPLRGLSGRNARSARAESPRLGRVESSDYTAARLLDRAAAGTRARRRHRGHRRTGDHKFHCGTGRTCVLARAGR
jgi:hypothetical protein